MLEEDEGGDGEGEEEARYHFNKAHCNCLK